MDLCRDEEWVRESARIEKECDGRIEAGLSMKAYAEAKCDDSLGSVRQVLGQQMRVQSILFMELHRWMKEWDIGIAFTPTYTEARELIRVHLKQPTPDVKEWIEALLSEDAQTPELVEKPVKAETRAKLLQMMTPEDWNKLETVASEAAASVVSSGIIKARQKEVHSAVAV